MPAQLPSKELWSCSSLSLVLTSSLPPLHLSVTIMPLCYDLMLSHRALTHCHCRLLPGRSATLWPSPLGRCVLKGVCIWRSGLCIHAAYAVHVAAFKVYHKVNTRSFKGTHRSELCVQYNVRHVKCVAHDMSGKISKHLKGHVFGSDG